MERKLLNESSLVSLKNRYALNGMENMSKKEEESSQSQTNFTDSRRMEPLKYEFTPLERETLNLEENLISLPEIDIYYDDEKEELSVPINLKQTTRRIDTLIEREKKRESDSTTIVDRKHWFLPKFLQSKKKSND